MMVLKRSLRPAARAFSRATSEHGDPVEREERGAQDFYERR
jgi:hypothetical protein